MSKIGVLVFAMAASVACAFSPSLILPGSSSSRITTKVSFFGKPEEPQSQSGAPEEESEKKPGITMQGLMELVMLGAGAPNLGKFTGVDEETGTLNFELEKNNFKSKTTGKNYNSFDNRDGTYFEAGYVDEDADIMAKFGKFFGGGKEDK